MCLAFFFLPFIISFYLSPVAPGLESHTHSMSVSKKEGDKKKKRTKPTKGKLSFGDDSEGEGATGGGGGGGGSEPKAKRRKKTLSFVNHDAVAEANASAEKKKAEQAADNAYSESHLSELRQQNDVIMAAVPEDVACDPAEEAAADAVADADGGPSPSAPTPTPLDDVADDDDDDGAVNVVGGKSIPSGDDIKLILMERKVRQMRADDDSYIPLTSGGGAQRGIGGGGGGVLDKLGLGGSDARAEPAPSIEALRRRGQMGLLDDGTDEVHQADHASPAFAADGDGESDEEGAVSFADQQLRRAAAAAAGVVDTSAAAAPSALDGRGGKESCLTTASFLEQVTGLRAQASRMKERATASEQNDGQLRQLLQVTELGLKELKEKAGKAEAAFHYMQELRNFFDALGDCYEDKMGEIKELMRKACMAGEDRHRRHLRSRLQWKQDEDAECSAACAAAAAPAAALDAAHEARIVERDAARAAGGVDAAAAAAEAAASKLAAELAEARRALMEEVDEAYGSAESVRAKLEEWRARDAGSYTSAAEPSLALCFEPFVNLDLCVWDPLRADPARPVAALADMGWWDALEPYTRAEGMVASIRSFIVAEIVSPHLSDYVAAAYDAQSVAQSRRLAPLLDDVATRHGLGAAAATKLGQAVTAAVGKAAATLAAAPCLAGSTHAAVEAAAAPPPPYASGRICDGAAVRAAARARQEACSTLVDNALLFSDAVPEPLLADAVVGGVIGGVLTTHLAALPRRTFAELAAAVAALHDELSKAAHAWYSLDVWAGQAAQQAAVQRRTAAIRELVAALAVSFAAARQAGGAAGSHEEMIDAARKFKAVCDLLGDRTTIRLILG